MHCIHHSAALQTSLVLMPQIRAAALEAQGRGSRVHGIAAEKLPASSGRNC
jgi:hypothetical protein